MFAHFAWKLAYWVDHEGNARADIDTQPNNKRRGGTKKLEGTFVHKSETRNRKTPNYPQQCPDNTHDSTDPTVSRSCFVNITPFASYKEYRYTSTTPGAKHQRKIHCAKQKRALEPMEHTADFFIPSTVFRMGMVMVDGGT
jgi:hypothetical protein